MSTPDATGGTTGRWYVAATLPRKEELAQEHLCRQGFAAFLPRRRKTVRHARKLTTSRAPFFPGYVFVTLDAAHPRWRVIDSTFGVRGLVRVGDRPAPLPRGLVEALIARTDAAGLLAPDLPPDLPPGGPVTLLAGPFAGLIGHFERLEAGERVRVLLRMLNGETAVVLPRRDGAPIDLAGDAAPARAMA